jgi:hypothetical protein
LDGGLANYRKARKGLDELATGKPGRKPIHPQYVAKLISELASDDAVFTFDVGITTVWAARYLKMNGRRRLIGSLVHGSMASAMPQAIGAQVAFPGRQVISMSGDGGFAMLMGDFLTLVQQNLPVKVVVFDNHVGILCSTRRPRFQPSRRIIRCQLRRGALKSTKRITRTTTRFMCGRILPRPADFQSLLRRSIVHRPVSRSEYRSLDLIWRIARRSRLLSSWNESSAVLCGLPVISHI